MYIAKYPAFRRLVLGSPPSLSGMYDESIGRDIYHRLGRDYLISGVCLRVVFPFLKWINNKLGA